MFCSDITKIKEVEVREQKMRSTFFSSVAHELRTPLNSVIPILKMILDTLIPKVAPNISEKIVEFLKVALNSSLHLQNVIEDALDISRIENNKFSLLLEPFDLGLAAKEACDIMGFQIRQKGLEFELAVSERVPRRIVTDAKRFKQVLFNLIGNAVKFTFTGGITVAIDYKEGALTTEVADTGIGIK